MKQQQTLLEKLAQTLINLFLVSDELSVTREQYKATVAAVIKEAKAEAIRDVEQCLGRDLEKAIEQLTWLDEFNDEEALHNQDLVEEWKDKEEPDWAAQDAMQRNDYDVMMGANGKTYRIEQQPR